MGTLKKIIGTILSPSVVLNLRKMIKGELLELKESKYGESIQVKGPDGRWYRCYVVDVLGEGSRMQVVIKRMDSLVVREDSKKCWPKPDAVQQVPLDLIERIPVFRTIRVAPPGAIVGTFGMVFSHSSGNSRSKRQICITKDGFLYIMDVTQMRVSEIVQRRVEIKNITGIWLKMVCTEDDPDSDPQLQVRLHVPVDIPDLVFETPYHCHGYAKFVDLRYIVDLIRIFRQDDDEFFIENLTEEREHRNEKFLDGIFGIEDNVPKPGERNKLRHAQQQQQQQRQQRMVNRAYSSSKSFPTIENSSTVHKQTFASPPPPTPVDINPIIKHSNPLKQPNEESFIPLLEAQEHSCRLRVEVDQMDYFQEYQNISYLERSLSHNKINQYHEGSHVNYKKPLNQRSEDGKVFHNFGGLLPYENSITETTTSESQTKTTHNSTQQSRAQTNFTHFSLEPFNVDSVSHTQTQLSSMNVSLTTLESQNRVSIIMEEENTFLIKKCQFLELRDSVRQTRSHSRLKKSEKLFHHRITELIETATAIDEKRHSQQKLQRLRSGKLKKQGSLTQRPEIYDETIQRIGIELDAFRSMCNFRSLHFSRLSRIGKNNDIVDIFEDDDFICYCDDVLRYAEDRLDDHQRKQHNEKSQSSVDYCTTFDSSVKMSSPQRNFVISPPVSPEEREAEFPKRFQEKQNIFQRQPSSDVFDCGESVPVTNVSHFDSPSYQSLPSFSRLATNPKKHTFKKSTGLFTCTVRRPGKSPKTPSFDKLPVQINLVNDSHSKPNLNVEEFIF